MKILHITNSLLGGGIENFLLSLLSEQARLGHEVFLVIIEKHIHDYSLNMESRIREKGVNVVCLNKIRHNKIAFIRTMFLCRKIVRKINPDVINTHGRLSHIYGAFATFLTKERHCITIHNTPEKWDILCKVFNKNKPLIFCSNAACEGREQRNKKFIVINNGVFPDLIKVDNTVNLRENLSLEDKAKVIVCVGALRPQKNYDFLKELSVRMKDEHVHFCICGGNYGKGYLNTDSFKDYCNIHFLGLRSDVSAIENGSDVFLSCSTFEGLPIAVLEAFYNGIPCVLSPIVPHKNIAKGVACCFIPQDFTSESFVESLRRALSVNDTHDEIYLQRKRTIAEYSINVTAMKYLKFYASIINGEKA